MARLGFAAGMNVNVNAGQQFNLEIMREREVKQRRLLRLFTADERLMYLALIRRLAERQRALKAGRRAGPKPGSH